MLREVLIGLIRWYRRWLSPLKPRCCRFEPTCSTYAAEALLVHGVAKGLLLIGWRILRCQPCARHGYDPVPPCGRWLHPRRVLSGCEHHRAAATPPDPAPASAAPCRGRRPRVSRP